MQYWRLISLLVIFANQNILSGQQSSLLTLKQYDLFMVHPANAGLNGRLSAYGIYREQWSGLGKQPISQFFGLHSPVLQWSGSLGMQLNHEAIGLENRYRILANYAYVRPSKSNLLSLSIGLGVDYLDIDESGIITPEGEYENGNVNHQDPLFENTTTVVDPFPIISGVFKTQFVDFFATCQIGGMQNKSGKWQTSRQLNFDITSDYLWNIFELKYGLGYKSDFVQQQIDIYSEITINGNIFGGLILAFGPNVRPEFVSLNAGFKLNNTWKMAYAYNYFLSSFSPLPSHEIGFFYSLDRRLASSALPRIKYNPRYVD